MADIPKGYIPKEKVLEYPIRLSNYDKEHGNRDFVLGIESVMEYVKAILPADVKEIHYAVWQQRTSKWLKLQGYKCSKCDFETLDTNAYKWLWCPNCGCFMGWVD